ncbi:MAG: cyclic nucleotide-binding domain-containing protein, partial [Gammaproteobacteria bacterium]|nr:cyclic nucleotide-binding domain-containing protein [Gammaproteobacteria bacterium]
MNINKELEYLISEIPVFRELDAEDTQVLSQYLFPKDLQADGLVCKEGQHGSFLSFVALGELEIFKTLDNKEVVISKISEGDSLGEMALIDGLTRSATVRACKPSTILILRRDDFNTLLTKHPVVGIKILKGIA